MSLFNGTIPAEVLGPPNGEPNFELCTLSTCPLEFAHFTYIPSLGGNAAFLAIFAAFVAPQLFLGIKGKTWGFAVGMICGLILEVLGYVGRVQMHFNPFTQSPFLMQIICLTLAPAFMTAAIYLCLGRIVVVFSETASRIKPRTYTIVFVSCDLVSLILQAAGGAVSSVATSDQASLQDAGVNIMIAGLSFQVASMFFFIVVAAEYAWRLHRRPSERNPRFDSLRQSRIFRAFLWGLGIATLTIFIRCLYRVAELSEGYSGDIFNDEVAFMVLEAPMIIIACIFLTVLHPALSFKGRWVECTWAFRSKSRPAGFSNSPVVLSSDEESLGAAKDKSDFPQPRR